MSDKTPQNGVELRVDRLTLTEQQAIKLVQLLERFKNDQR